MWGSFFFNNLILIGLNSVSFEEKYGIPFHKCMFDLPNKKGYEIVTNFLFSKLSAVTEKDYNLPWPLLNKELERIFQKTCYSHLSDFSQENEVKFPRIVPSLLATFGGVRFYELYFAFSSYVLKKIIRKNANINILSRPKVTQENFTVVNEIVQLSTITSKDKFMDIETTTYINDIIWTKFAKNLSECLQKLKQLQRTNEELLRIKKTIVANLYGTVPDEDPRLENLVEKSINILKLANKERKTLDQFFSSEEKLWQHLASEVGENVDSEVLNGENINIEVIDNLPENFNTELKKVGFSSSRKDGKTSVIRLLELLRAYLRSLTELISTTSINDLSEIDMNDLLTTQQDLLSINSLNKRLSEEIIPALEENVNQLKVSQLLEDRENFFESPLNQVCSLPVQIYNPEAVKTRLMHIYPDLEENLRLYSSDGCRNLDDDHFSAANLSEVNTSTNTTLSNTALPFMCKQKLGSEREDFAGSSYSSKSNILQDNIPSSFDINISALDDIDFAPSTHFKMRQSWLQEESLSAMTLPNISFDD